MTTGRINQVTTTRIGAAAGGGPPNTTRRWGIESRDWGTPERAQPAEPPSAVRLGAGGPSMCPHRVSQDTFRRVVVLGPRRAARRRGIGIQRGGHPPPDTPLGGYRRRLSPRDLAEQRPLAIHPQTELVPGGWTAGSSVPPERREQRPGCRPEAGRDLVHRGFRPTTSRGLKARRLHNSAFKRPEIRVGDSRVSHTPFSYTLGPTLYPKMPNPGTCIGKGFFGSKFVWENRKIGIDVSRA